MKKEDYIKAINTSLFFTADAEKEPGLYKREKNKLLANIFNYKMLESKENEKYGLEIMEIALKCIEYYDLSKGPFINYFNKSFKIEKKRSKTEEKIAQKSGGLHISSEMKGLLSKLHNYLKKHSHIDLSNLENTMDLFSFELGVEEKKVKEVIQIYRNMEVRSGEGTLFDDADKTLFDTLESGTNIEKELINKEKFIEYIDAFESEYIASRDNIKRFISIKLTSELTFWDKNEDYTSYISKMTFFDEETFNKVYYRNEKLQNKEISIILNKSEPNLTQTWARFCERVKEKNNL